MPFFVIIVMLSTSYDLPSHSLLNQLDPLPSSTGVVDQDQQLRLFDEHNDDYDDAYGYGNFGGDKNDNLRVVLVAPDRSPVAPPLLGSGCFGKHKIPVPTAVTEKRTSSGAPGEDAVKDTTTGRQPVLVLTGGWGRGTGRARSWKIRRDSEEAKRKDDAPQLAATGNENDLGEERMHSGTEVGLGS